MLLNQSWLYSKKCSLELLQIILIWRLLHFQFSETIYFSWNNFISPFSQGYSQQSKIALIFYCRKIYVVLNAILSVLSTKKNCLSQCNNLVIFGHKVTWLWHWFWKCVNGRMPAKCPERKWEFCYFVTHISPFLSFPCLPLCQKRDPDDDDCNEFDGENVGRQNVSKGNENCARHS